MKNYNVSLTPEVGVCINKSRLKIYHKETTPTYYIENGQEFSVELFNPLSETILAKIQLNGKEISQGGLVLRPGERVFLERYFDVARKFKFETYEVSSTAEVRSAIKDNGGLKVQFYREKIKPVFNYIPINTVTVYPPIYYPPFPPAPSPYPYTYRYNNTGGACCDSLGIDSNMKSRSAAQSGLAHGGSVSCFNMSTNITASAGVASFTTTSNSLSTAGLNDTSKRPTSSLRSLSKKNEKIETGRVEAGSYSNQSFEYIQKEFETYWFHTVEYKLLPVSNKTNTSEDLNVKRYCHNCSAKVKAEWKYCPKCSERL